jgi:hypothetical protein
VGQQDVVIIGAPRSGTNMLRDVLTRLPEVGTWPCDEINYIWRHGNLRYPSDAFPADLARPKVVTYIRRQFEKLATAHGLNFVVEKTCANSLRVEFVDKVLPDAKYIYIVRDGRDVVASAMKRWKAELDLRYIMNKVRYVPVSDLPYYALNYLGNRVYRLFSKEGRLAYWGPRLDNMDSILVEHDLAGVCAIQWCECVNHADHAFCRISSERVHKLSYEGFVADPVLELDRLCDFLGIQLSGHGRETFIGSISRSSVGKGLGDLGKQLYGIESLMEAALRRHGYL